MFSVCSYFDILVYGCCILIGNTSKFKSHNDSQNLYLDFVITATQREDIS